MIRTADGHAQSVGILGRVLQHVSQHCEVMSITHCRGLGTSVGIEFDDPKTRKRLGGLVSVRPASRLELPIVAISIGLKDFVVSSLEETDSLPVFHDNDVFVDCFRSPNRAA